MCLAALSKLTYFLLHKADNMHMCVYSCACMCNIFGWTGGGIRCGGGERAARMNLCICQPHSLLKIHIVLLFNLCCDEVFCTAAESKGKERSNICQVRKAIEM